MVRIEFIKNQYCILCQDVLEHLEITAVVATDDFFIHLIAKKVEQ
jgi:hypothetical protein